MSGPTKKKALCYTCPVGGTYDKYWLPPIAELVHTSVGRVGWYTDLVGCVLVPLGLRCPSPQALTLLGGARFISWCLGCSFLKECWRGPRHFWSHRHVWALALHLDPPKKWPCAILVQSVGWITNTNFLPAVKHNSFKRTLLPTVLTHSYFVYMFHLFNTFVPPTFSSSVSSFWLLTRYNSISIL